MSSAEQSNFPAQYEVTVTTLDELTALQGLGLAMQRLDPSPSPSESDTLLTDEALWAVSQTVFGTPIYGQGAGSYVHLLGEGAKSTITITRRGVEQDFDTQAWQFHPAPPNADRGVTEAKNEEDVRQALTEPITPFPLHVERLPSKPTKLRVTPGALSTRSLAAFVAAQQYPRHRLHGAVGKTLDVLVRAANMTPLHGSVESPDDDFITYDELSRTIDENTLGTAADVLRGKISFAFMRQLLSGQPLPKGEVIFEGGFEIAVNRRDVTVKYGTIARKTLRVIAGDYGRDTPAKRLLLDISA